MEHIQTTEQEFHHEVENIFDDIWQARRELPNGDTGWLGYDLSEGQLTLRGQKGLYAGRLGIALYFAAMYNVFGEDSHYRAVDESVSYLLKSDVDALTEQSDIGGGDGLGSVIYGLSVLSQLTAENKYEDRAHELASSLTEEKIEEDDEYDLLLGVSGTLLGLLRLYERSGEQTVLEKAMKCGDHLLNNRDKKWGHRVWDTHWNNNLSSFSTGMGHGAAGIGYALYRLYDHTNHDEFRAAADEALRFENIFYSNQRNNWKANWVTIPSYPNWWCYGLSGIGLARLGTLQHYHSESIKEDVNQIAEFDPTLGEKDSICHGTFSQVELLIELGKRFDETYTNSATKLALQAIRRKKNTGGYRVVCGDINGIYNPIFFLGTAGIGYTILRLLYPNDLPSILRFE